MFFPPYTVCKMNSPDPVFCQLFEGSCSRIHRDSSKEVSFFFHLSGNHILKTGGAVFDSDQSFAFIIPSAVPFSVRGNGRAYLFTCGQSFLNELLSTGFGSRISGLFSGFSIYRGFRLNSDTELRADNILNNILREISLKRSDYLDMVHINLYEILILLKRNGSLSEKELQTWAGQQRVWDIDDVIQHVTENYDNAFSLENLASRCALNSSYFSRSFKEHAGIPLFEYINRLRIDRACQLLKNSTMTILDIALSVGYNNVSFFNRYFKKLKNMSPGEYRRRMRL